MARPFFVGDELDFTNEASYALSSDLSVISATGTKLVATGEGIASVILFNSSNAVVDAFNVICIATSRPDTYLPALGRRVRINKIKNRLTGLSVFLNLTKLAGVSTEPQTPVGVSNMSLTRGDDYMGNASLLLSFDFTGDIQALMGSVSDAMDNPVNFQVLENQSMMGMIDFTQLSAGPHYTATALISLMNYDYLVQPLVFKLWDGSALHQQALSVVLNNIISVEKSGNLINVTHDNAKGNGDTVQYNITKNDAYVTSGNFDASPDSGSLDLSQLGLSSGSYVIQLWLQTNSGDKVDYSFTY